MHLIISLFALVFFFSTTAQEVEWDLAKEENGITVYTRHVEGSKIKEYKATMEIDASIDDIYEIITDVPNIDTWYHNARNPSWVEHISDTEGIYYVEFDSPWPARDRDNVAHYTIVKDEPAGGFTVHFTCAEGKVPEKKKFVRVEKLRAVWIVSPLSNGKISVVHQGHVEPKKIPAWIANSFVVQTPYETFKNLQNKLKK